jgi:penicillin-binding protein 2
MSLNFLKTKKRKYSHIDADEVFLDSKNLPNFNKQQLEGKIEKTLSKKTIYILIFVISLITIIFIFQLYFLQIKNGNQNYNASIQNALDREIVFAERGIIYDRNMIPLAWNEKNIESDNFLIRKYFSSGGLGHILGYVKYPKKDARGYFWRTEYVGMDGIEKQFNEVLSGENGARLIETNVEGGILSSNIYEDSKKGENVVLSIDKELQIDLFESIKDVSISSNYVGGSGILFDLKTGEVLAMASFPSYDSNIMAESKDENIISGYFSNHAHPLLNRAISGIYTPGSIVKTVVGIGALTEGVINENTKILSQGSISIQNPYNKSLKTVFKDFRPNNGLVNIKEALSVSSNIFFYNVGGGYGSQKGIGINKIAEYFSMFGFDKKTNIELPGEQSGLIPGIEWKEKNFPNDPTWRIGDTYNTVIGQYGVQVTPVEMLKVVSLIALNGKEVPISILKKYEEVDLSKVKDIESVHDESFSIIKEGMRLAVTSKVGTAKGLFSMQNDFAAKTGIAQVGPRNEFINTWIMGFYPYENPQYAFVMLMDRGVNSALAGAPTVAWSFFNKFEKSDFYLNRK